VLRAELGSFSAEQAPNMQAIAFSSIRWSLKTLNVPLDHSTASQGDYISFLELSTWNVVKKDTSLSQLAPRFWTNLIKASVRRAADL
jgi:hypothetical protein